MPQMIVLDTHAWFWWINLEYQRFSATMRAAMEGIETMGVSVVSCYSTPIQVVEFLNISLKITKIKVLNIN